MTSHFGIVGDVHGQLDKLVGLLSYMGYREIGGAWRHPSRSVIYVGDLIDRGPKPFATVDLVRRIVEAGSARKRQLLHRPEYNRGFNPNQ